jgi:Arc/MetJ-type ribon-helix-helix transcriptional regulator
MKTKISISLPKKMAEDLRKAVRRVNYSSKSDFVEKLLIEKFKKKAVQFTENLKNKYILQNQHVLNL